MAIRDNLPLRIVLIIVNGHGLMNANCEIAEL